jgi:hypothetical protein
MPFSNYRDNFEPETLAVLEVAFNAVWEVVQASGGEFDQNNEERVSRPHQATARIPGMGSGPTRAGGRRRHPTRLVSPADDRQRAVPRLIERAAIEGAVRSNN